MSFDVVSWMQQHGHPGYANRIARYERAATLALTHNLRGAARRIAALDRRIADVRRDAFERYDDKPAKQPD